MPLKKRPCRSTLLELPLIGETPDGIGSLHRIVADDTYKPHAPARSINCGGERVPGKGTICLLLYSVITMFYAYFGMSENLHHLLPEHGIIPIMARISYM
ncbi:hypothetical protein SCHPADRAFT_901910 [Schizopora paradoxa]|uniref:Uncharacterized protein n=1 Tax=Schizopora paradoxa TaxID=27342 RepID=A0A0H2S2G8_9AGAM|nr:hypothetical protein SCHPADRAFT_901910 [Schizopora paradoxa]